MLLNKNELCILEEFSPDYHRKIYGGGVAKKLKMNQKTVSNILKKLEQEDILKFAAEGKNKYYFLNRFNPKITDVIKLIEIGRKIRFLEKYKKLQGLFYELEKRTQDMLVIFGSYANYSANEKSDLDVFVLGKIKDVNDLEKLYHIKINVIKSSKEKFDKSNVFIKEVVKNHVVLKGIEEFIELIWEV